MATTEREDAPADVIRQVTRGERLIKRMSGADFSEGRRAKWQEYNRERV